MKKVIIFFFLLISSELFSQLKDSLIYEFEGYFAFANDEELTSIDDMIFRESYFLKINDCGNIDNNSIFIMDYLLKGINYEVKSDSTFVKKIQDEKYMKNNDEKYLFFSDTKTQEKIYYKKKYKIFKLKFIAYYLGNLEQKIRVNKKFKTKLIPTFFIYDFKVHEVVPKNE